MEKYIFANGGEPTDETDFYNGLVDNLNNLTQQDDQQQQQAAQEPAQDEESDYIKNLRSAADEDQITSDKEDLDARFRAMEEHLSEKYSQLQSEKDEYDYFQSEDGINEIVSSYNTRDHSMNNANSGGFGGIFKNEGARTGQATNLNSSAIGRGQMVKGTRVAMYKKLGINNIAQAEEQYRSDPKFEMVVLNKYKDELSQRIPNSIQGPERDYMIAKGWYTGDPNYPDNKVPHPEAGNKLTAGQYAARAIKGI